MCLSCLSALNAPDSIISHPEITIQQMAVLKQLAMSDMISEQYECLNLLALLITFGKTALQGIFVKNVCIRNILCTPRRSISAYMQLSDVLSVNTRYITSEYVFYFNFKNNVNRLFKATKLDGVNFRHKCRVRNDATSTSIQFNHFHF